MYNSSGGKNYFQSVDNEKVVYFNTPIKNEHIEIMQSYSVFKVEELTPFSCKIVTDMDKYELYNNLMEWELDIHYVSEMLESENGGLLWISNILLVRFLPKFEISSILSDVNISYQTIEKIGSEPNTYMVTLKNPMDKDAFVAANLLYESGKVVYAQPSFWRILTMHNPYKDYQWNIENSGQYGGTVGMDINVQDAWKISKGEGIKIAVLDEGVDLSHPDLVNNLLPGFDATDGVLGGVDGNCKGNDSHGTMCAGIIAAEDNNIGVIGVAPKSKIIPIRMAYKINRQWEMRDDWTVTAFHAAWTTHQADIISCSWTLLDSIETLSAEIRAALANGRSGLGTVIVHASGNDDNTNILYPANKFPEIIVVGASNPCGLRKSPITCDSVKWGSNYGEYLDVIAPGIYIATTDIQGTSGYNQGGTAYSPVGLVWEFTDRSYTRFFDGTSAAAPHVAGVAALMLSVNPSLTQKQVADAIEYSARKTNPDLQVYQSRPNGIWNEEIGYGLSMRFQPY